MMMTLEARAVSLYAKITDLCNGLRLDLPFRKVYSLLFILFVYI